jgi:hypothetical protein
VATRRKGTMLIRLSSSEQFGQRVSESMLNLVLNGSKDPMKQTKAHKTKLKQPQNGIRLSLKPTPISKRNKTKEKHKKKGHLQK